MRRLKYLVAAILVIILMLLIGYAMKAGVSTDEFPQETYIKTTYEPKPETEIKVVETTIIDTTAPESTEPETTISETTEPQTEVMVEYMVQGGNVWVEGSEEPETDLAILVTTLVEIPLEPETDFSDTPNGETPVTIPETEPITYEPIVKPNRNDYETSGTYAPISMMYHSINETPFTSLTGLFVRPVDFEDQLATLNSLGYEYIFADEYAYTDTPSVMLTFDDGYVDNYTEMFPILKKYNAKATIFMITSAIDRPGYLSSEQIKEMADSGLVRFASHTHNHYSLTSLSETDIRYQFEYSKQILKELTGHETNAICYPGGSVSEEIAKIAEDYYCFGYTTVNSASTYGCDPMQIPRVRVSRGVSGTGLASLIGYIF